MPNKWLSKDQIVKLRQELHAFASKGLPVPIANRADMIKRYGIPPSTFVFHLKTVRKELKAPAIKALIKGTVINNGHTLDIEALKRDSASDMSDEEIRARHNLPENGQLRPLGKPPADVIEPMTKEQCLKVCKLLERIATNKPEVFTQLDIVATLSKKYPRIWQDIL